MAEPEIVKQDPTPATTRRSWTIAISVPVLTTALVGLMIWIGRITQYFMPGFPVIDDPLYLTAIASTGAGIIAGYTSQTMRGTRHARRATDPEPEGS